MKNKIILFTIYLFFSSVSFANNTNLEFINRDFSLGGGKIIHRPANPYPFNVSINNESETYKSITSDVTANEFYHVHLKKVKNIPFRTFEFTQGTSGLRSGTVKFNDKGEPLAFTGCDVWSGCITITKQLCNSILKVNGKTAEKVNECTQVLRDVLNSESFKSPQYQKLASEEYTEIDKYRKDNHLVGKNEDKWESKISRFFATDKGEINVNDLKQNQSKNLGDHYWDYTFAIQSIGRIYQLCQDHSENLVLGPEEKDPNMKTITVPIHTKVK
jgi:hypothetical protein